MFVIISIELSIFLLYCNFQEFMEAIVLDRGAMTVTEHECAEPVTCSNNKRIDTAFTNPFSLAASYFGSFVHVKQYLSSSPKALGLIGRLSLMDIVRDRKKGLITDSFSYSQVATLSRLL